MPTSKVIVTDHFAAFGHEIARAVERSLPKMGAVVAHEAQSKPTKYRIHGILAKIKATGGARRTARGWQINVVAADFREIFFEKGTYRHRRAKLKQPGRRRAGSELRGGIKPGGFMTKGLRAARPQLVRVLEREMAGIGRRP